MCTKYIYSALGVHRKGGVMKILDFVEIWTVVKDFPKQTNANIHRQVNVQIYL